MKVKIEVTRDDPRYLAEFAVAACNAGEPDHAEIAEFCRRLTGLQGEDYLDICDEVEDLELPTGFTHARVFDVADGSQISAAISNTGKPLTGCEVTLLVTLQERFEEGRWVETLPLPVTDPGVLDLLVRFEPRISPGRCTE